MFQVARGAEIMSRHVSLLDALPAGVKILRAMIEAGESGAVEIHDWDARVVWREQALPI